MAQPRHKGKSKQKKIKPAVVVEAEATPVEETKVVEKPVELSPKEAKKLEKEKAKKEQAIAKEKANKKKEEAREKAGKLTIGQRFKETGSELKKISWPSFGKTWKKTWVVIAVVLFFAVVLVAFDFGLYWLYNLLLGK